MRKRSTRTTLSGAWQRLIKRDCLQSSIHRKLGPATDNPKIPAAEKAFSEGLGQATLIAPCLSMGRREPRPPTSCKDLAEKKALVRTGTFKSTRYPLYFTLKP